jgi:hypothetical protein
VGREIAGDDELADVAPGGAQHEERPADGRRQPEAAAEEDAQERGDAQPPSCSPTSSWNRLPFGQPMSYAA